MATRPHNQRKRASTMAETPNHKFRIPPEEWRPAYDLLKTQGESVTSVVRHAIREEVAMEERKASGRELSPERTGGRDWYHYRHGKLVEVIMDESDAWALEHITLMGWELWPCEWGVKK